MLRLPIFTTLKRGATEPVRQHSRRALGGAALATAALAGPGRVAGKKKQGKVCQTKEQERCRRDFEDCRVTVLANCRVPGSCGPAVVCCETCSAAGFMECAVVSTA
jgi:hypothetical protein